MVCFILVKLGTVCQVRMRLLFGGVPCVEQLSFGSRSHRNNTVEFSIENSGDIRNVHIGFRCK